MFRALTLNHWLRLGLILGVLSVSACRGPAEGGSEFGNPRLVLGTIVQEAQTLQLQALLGDDCLWTHVIAEASDGSQTRIAVDATCSFELSLNTEQAYQLTIQRAGEERGSLVGGLTLFVAQVLTPLHVHSWPLTILTMLLIACIFSCSGIIAALWAESWDHLASIATFGITPFTYLGGVFYSTHMLPPTWHVVSQCNPLFYMIDALRWSTLNHGDAAWLLDMSLIGSLAISSLLLAIYLFKKGYKLIV